jgi:ABC-type nitrate/sulfonate/bicarbonate transport system substrate-binding protein
VRSSTDRPTTRTRVGNAVRSTPLRIGFIDLIDAAPLIVALEQGFFADEGLPVVLERQLGWGNIRDRLTFGQLDAAHALLGMPLFSRIGRDWFLEPLVALMNLGSGGNAITLSRRLIDAGVRSAVTLAQYIRNDPRHEVMVFGHVFSCSMHHYLLRDWLASGGIDPDVDVRLRVFPPNQMAGHMAREYVQGFCVGEPWNTLAQRNGAGDIVAVTTDIVPEHPEKILAVTQRWLDANGPLGVPMIRAVLRGCAFCEDERNADALAELLARPQYLNAPREVIRQALAMDRNVARSFSPPVARSSDWRIRSFAPPATFPSKTHSAWFAAQMIRWGHLRRDADVLAMARGCSGTSAYRAAARSLEVECPATDFPPMHLRCGLFDPLGSVAVRATEFQK